MKEGSIVKDITGLLLVGGLGFAAYKFFANKGEEEKMQANKLTIINDANKSGKSILPQVKEVITDLNKNPKLATFTASQYKVLADSIESYIKANKSENLSAIFSKLKTNTDLKLLSIYFGVRVYKKDSITGFKIETWNLGQWITNLVPPFERQKINAILDKNKITFKIF